MALAELKVEHDRHTVTKETGEARFLWMRFQGQKSTRYIRATLVVSFFGPPHTVERHVLFDAVLAPETRDYGNEGSLTFDHYDVYDEDVKEAMAFMGTLAARGWRVKQAAQAVSIFLEQGKRFGDGIPQFPPVIISTDEE